MKYDEARQAYEESLEPPGRRFGTDHPEYALVVENLDGIAIYNEVLPRLTAINGEIHVDTAATLRNPGLALCKAGRTRRVVGVLDIEPKAKQSRHPLPVGWVGLFLICILFTFPASAQSTAVADPDTAAPPTGGTVFLPVIGYTPDTKLMLGASAIRFFYLDEPGQDVRPSTFSPTFIYTLKSQVMVFMGTDLNWDEGRSHAGIFPNYIKFPDQYYGIGREVSLDDQEDYTPEQINLELSFDREILGHLRPGVNCRLQRHRLIKVDPAGELAGGSINGVENSLVSLPGISLAWDTRDNLWSPSRGLWLQVGAAFARTSFGSDYHFNQFTADFRGYLPLGKKAVLAAQVMMVGLDGDPPFFAFPRLGGDEGLRGYRGGLFRDLTSSLARIEYRRDRIAGRFGGAIFAGLGDVAPDVGRLTTVGKLWSTGFGVRYLWDEAEKLKIRLDLGWGNGDSGFYLTLGEAF